MSFGAAVADNLFALSQASEEEQGAIIETIKTRINDRVRSAIENGLTGWQKTRVFLGTLNLDDIIGNDFQNFPDLLPTPILLTFGVNPAGRLLFYRDTTQNGTGDVANPSVIGLGGWQNFKFLFSGGNGIIYAVDQDGSCCSTATLLRTGPAMSPTPRSLAWADGRTSSPSSPAATASSTPWTRTARLLFYRDTTQNGTGDVANPSVIGLGGWQNFKFLFSGGNGIIYAVDQAGQLLFYRDTTQNGTGDVANPSVIGQGGWQNFKFLFSGGNGIIYAVDQDGSCCFTATLLRTGPAMSPTPRSLAWADGRTSSFSSPAATASSTPWTRPPGRRMNTRSKAIFWCGPSASIAARPRSTPSRTPNPPSMPLTARSGHFRLSCSTPHPPRSPSSSRRSSV